MPLRIRPPSAGARGVPDGSTPPDRSRDRTAAVARAAAQAALLLGACGAGWWAAGPSRALPDPAATVRLGIAYAGCAAVALALLLRAVVRSRGAARRSWLSVAAAVVLWMLALHGSTAGWTSTTVWWVLRALGCLGVALGLALAPGVRRGREDWLLLALDGWLVAGSAVELCWLVLDWKDSLGVLQASSAHPSDALWALWDVVMVALLGGLALRLRYPHRAPVALTCLAGTATLWGDLSRLADHPRAAVVCFLAALAGVAAATVTPRLDIWAGAERDPDAVRLSRPSHVIAVPGLLAAALAEHRDPLILTVAMSLLVVLGVEILLNTAVTRAVWETAKAQTERLDAVLRESRDAILVVREGGVVDYANPAAADVLGHAPERLVGSHLHHLVHPDDVDGMRQAIRRLERDGEPARLVGRIRRSAGTWRHVECTASRRWDGGFRGLVVVARDVEDRVRLEEELRRQAGTDPLTGLLNRQAFLTAMQAYRAAGPMAVLFCDLDGFKAVNDSEGHVAGDALLCRAAEVLERAARPGQLAARLGGDEFAMLVPPGEVPSASALESVERAAEQLATTLVAQLRGTRPDGRIGVSIGLALAATPGTDEPSGGAGPAGLADAWSRGGTGAGEGRRSTELLRDADLAMYEAKARGGNGWVRFEPAMRERVIARSQLRADLERAIADDGLAIDVQPIVDAGTGAWSQFEALVRWRQGDAVRMPGDFIPLAEETGLIVPLGSWVLRTALAWLAAWPDAAAGISVNVTGAQVAEPGFVDMVTGELDRHGLAPGRLTLEITEQTAVEDLDRAGAVLQPLRALGVHVALDDFGTGYCSLGYLAQLPVDELKIDRRFVSGLGVRDEDDALVRAVLGLADDLGLRVVAEGVETAEQARILAGYGCPLMQGFLYARPVPAALIVPPDGARPAVPRQAGAGPRRKAASPKRV